MKYNSEDFCNDWLTNIVNPSCYLKEGSKQRKKAFEFITGQLSLTKFMCLSKEWKWKCSRSLQNFPEGVGHFSFQCQASP